MSVACPPPGEADPGAGFAPGFALAAGFPWAAGAAALPLWLWPEDAAGFGCCAGTSVAKPMRRRAGTATREKARIMTRTIRGRNLTGQGGARTFNRLTKPAELRWSRQ